MCGLFTVAHAHVNSDAYRDYFLIGQFGEVCTMCEAAVLCEDGSISPTYVGIPAEDDFTLYCIQTRTFWSQVPTIGSGSLLTSALIGSLRGAITALCGVMKLVMRPGLLPK